MADTSAFDISDGDSETYEPATLKKKTVTKAPTKSKAKAPAKKTTAQNPTESKRAFASDDDSDAIFSSTPPAAKRPKKAPAAARKTTTKPKKVLTTLTNVNDSIFEDETVGNRDSPAKLPKGVDAGTNAKSASETYQKISQEDHIMKRPDTYIGSIERTERAMWIHDAASDSMVWREVSYVPGLYKIFDELMVNAADNKIRDPTMDTMKVTLNRETNVISVYNNGKGLPIEIHKTEKIYIPQMIFGTLLTSSNYDDDEKKVTGGRNGFGAKLCNIFSKEFVVETADKGSKEKYKQIWKNNMTICGKPKITSGGKAEEYTKVTFAADFKRFGMEGIDDDFEALVRRRVYDVAGSVKNLKVFFNDERIKVKNFKDYMQMHVSAIHREKYGEGSDVKKPEIVYEQVNDRWEVGFAVSDGAFQQVSFVNSIATTAGGTHVQLVSDSIANRIAEDLKKSKEKGLALLKPAQIKTHFFLFVNCLIENPAFTSQTKEQLTTKASAFGSKCVLSDSFFKRLNNTELKESITEFARAKADQTLKKTDGARRARINNPKLVDANKAGTKDGYQCTLILTEGDSAKSLAISGMEVVGRDLFGVFPLRGKLLNVRDASVSQIANNAEIQNIKQILGLQHGKVYTETTRLRYGHLMIMTDQDHDGSHIKGLLINFLEAQYPSLLRLPGFLIEFITPIVKVYKGSILKPTKTKAFFTMPEYEYWKENNSEKGWQKKYYKGLGTSSSVEAKEYFSDLDKHLKTFHAMKSEEQQLIQMVFSKTKAEERKEWLRLFKPGTYLDHSIDKISYDDFVNRELILYSMADNIRSIPSVVDGLKPGQRKVLFACFKRKLVREIKVSQLAGYVSEHTHYQHGEQSLATTIIALAQNFVGSNNVNLLEPIGNFGTRIAGGKDASSPRYVNTMLSPLARALFPALDDALLEHNVEDGDRIEPVWYAPVLPLILINGSDGIGTGWSSSIPNYNPEDVATNIRHLMNDEELEPMTPWYRGFNGTVERIGPEKYSFTGAVNQVNDTSCEITELPVRMWTNDLKERLDNIIKPIEVKAADKKDKREKTESKPEKPWIKDYLDYNSDLRVHFIVEMDSKSAMDAALKEGLLSKFKLTKTATLTNMVAFDPQGRIMRYDTVDAILKEFYVVRLKMYQLRKEYVLGEMNKLLRRLNNQARFIKMIISKELVVSNKKRDLLVAELKRLKFDIFSNKKEAEDVGEDAPTVGEEVDETKDDEAVGDGFNYLLGMAIWSLTKEKVDKLLAEVRAKEFEIEELTKLSPKNLWERDLDAFVEEWRRQLEEEKRRNMTKSAVKKSKKVKVASGKLAAKKLLTGKDGDSDEEFEVKPKKKPAAVRSTIAKANDLKQTTLFSKQQLPIKSEDTSETREKKPNILMDLDMASEDDIVPVKRESFVRPNKNSKRIIEVSEDDDGFHSDIQSDVPVKKETKRTTNDSEKTHSKSLPSLFDLESEDEIVVVRKTINKPVKIESKSAKTDTTAPKKKPSAFQDNDSSLSELSDASDSDAPPPAAKKATGKASSKSSVPAKVAEARGRRAASKVATYTIDDSDDDEGSAHSESEEDVFSDDSD